MGYFSNGTEGMCFQDSYCFECRHWKLRRPPGDTKGEAETEGCPIWDAHMIADYCDETQAVLSMLIARGERGGNVCLMFESAASATDDEWREYLDSMPMPPKEEEARR